MLAPDQTGGKVRGGRRSCVWLMLVVAHGLSVRLTVARCMRVANGDGRGVSTGRSIRAPHAPHAIHTRSSSVPPLRTPHNRCSRKKAWKSSSSRSLIAWQLTSAPLGDPRSNEAETYTSNDDGDGESDETEPEPLKVRHHKSRFGVNDA
jgi:hypothetical protein